MNRTKRLLRCYANHIAVPWRADAAAAQRVVFCVYRETDELLLRATIDEFELATKDAGHGWERFDLTDIFPDWLMSQRYAKNYFEKPHLLSTLLPKFLPHIADRFQAFLATTGASHDTVISISGIGSLFGLVKVKEVVDKIAPMVPGRLVVFFPGSFEDNNYRLLDAYDGWNYLAVPLTADQDL